MASTYEYITVANLESFMAIDFENTDSGYTDSVVEARITMAERFINSVCHQSFSGTIPDAVVMATTIMAERLMLSLMKSDHPESFNEQPDKDFFDQLINLALEDEKYSPVGSIPMQGLDR